MRCRNLSSPPGSRLTPWSSFPYLSCSTGSLSLRGVTPHPGFWLSVLCPPLSASLQLSSSAPRTWIMVQGFLSCSCSVSPTFRGFSRLGASVSRSLHYLRRHGPDHRLRRGS